MWCRRGTTWLSKFAVSRGSTMTSNGSNVKPASSLDASNSGRVPEWRADDLDERFREGQLKAIVGIEIDVLSIEGKAKLSQNRPEIDRANVRRSFAGGTLEERMVAERMDPPRE